MRRRTAIVSLAVALVLVIPGVSIGGDRFSDVPSTNTFHDDITWLADQGVTKGCNPPANSQFCPKDAVTREQMAAFMRRFAGTISGGGGGATESRLIGAEASDTTLPENNWRTLASMQITAPAGGGALLLNGTAGLFVQTDLDTGGLGILEVTVDEGCSSASDGIPSLFNTFSVGADSATAVGSLPISSGTHTVRLCAIAFHVDTSESTDVLSPRVSALWAPDGHVATLAAASDGNAKQKLLERASSGVASFGPKESGE